MDGHVFALLLSGREQAAQTDRQTDRDRPNVTSSWTSTTKAIIHETVATHTSTT
jgi:hypothetical protein